VFLDKVSGEELMGFHVVRPAIFVEVFVIVPICNLGLNKVLDLLVEEGKRLGSHSVGAVYCSMDDVIPSEIVGAFEEV
jgi:hypothetical protein